MKMRNPDIIKLVRVITEMKEVMGDGKTAVEKDFFGFFIIPGGYKNRGVAMLAVTGFTNTDKSSFIIRLQVTGDRIQVKSCYG